MKLLFFLRPTLIMLIILILSIIINSTYAKTKVLYLSHVSVRGIRSATSTNPINGNVTIVSPTTNNTIDDLNVTAFVNTTVYDSERDTTYKSLPCTYGSVVNGSATSCHNAILLEMRTKAQAVDDIGRAIMRISQSMYLDNSNNRRRRLITTKRRKLLSNDFKELNAVFQGMILQIPDQNIEKSIWPSTLKIKITRLLCGEVTIGDISIQASQPSANVVNANIRLVSLNVMCSANYRYDWGWFGGDGSVSAGGSQQSIDTTITVANDGTASINSCSSNVDLTHLSFSGGIVSSIADLFKSLFKGKLEEVLESTICDELGPLGSSVITDLAKTVKKETDPYLPASHGGTYVSNVQEPLLKENSLVDEYQSSLISWKDMLMNTSSTDPIALLVPKVFSTINEYFSNNESGINHFVRQHVLESDGTLTINFANATSPRGLMLYEGVDPLTSTSLGMSNVVVRGLDQWTIFRPLLVLGDQTLGHELKMTGKLTASATLSLRIAPSTASDSLIHQHQGHTVNENPQISISLSDLHFDAATYVGVSKEETLSMKLGSIEQAPLECIASAVDELEIRKFLTTIRDIEEPLMSGFLSVGIDRLFSQAMHLVYLKYETRMKQAMPNYLTSTGSDLLNTELLAFLKSHDQRYEKTCPDPSTPYNAGHYLDFRANEIWTQFQSAVLGPFLENNASSLNNLINSSTDAGSIHNVLGDNLTKKTNVDSGTGVLGNLQISAGNIGVHNLNTIHDVELLTATSKHHGTDFAGVDSWLPVEHNNSKYLLSTALSVGTKEKPMQGSMDFFFSVEGGDANNQSPFLNDFTLTIGVSDLEMLLQMLVKVDVGHVKHLQLRHITSLDCWVSTIGELMFHQVHAKVKGSLFAGIKCRTCTSPGFRDLEKVLRTEQASKDLTKLVNDILAFIGNVVESKTVQDEINEWLSGSKLRCTIASDGYAPDGQYHDVDKLKMESNDAPPPVVNGNDSNAALDYMLFAFIGVLIGAVIMCFRFYSKERHWQQELLRLETELEQRNKGKKKQDKEPTPLISATRSLFLSPHVPLFIRLLVPIVLLANAGFFLSGHLSLGALVRLFISVAGEDITIPSVFTFSMAQSTIDMWSAGAYMLAIIIIVFSGIWPYTKVCISMFLWLAPPTWYAPTSRGAAFMWLDALGKWSIIDIFVLVLSMVGFHLIILSPEVSFLPPNFWKIEISVVPVWGLYSNLIAQVQSQIISHICIYYHRNSVAAVEEAIGHKLLDIEAVKKIIAGEKKLEIKIVENPLVKTNSSNLATIEESDEEDNDNRGINNGGVSSKIQLFDGISSSNDKKKKTTIKKSKRTKKNKTGGRNRSSTTWLESQDNIRGPRKSLINKKAALRFHYFEMKSDEGETKEIGRLRVQVSPCGQWLVIIGIIATEMLLLFGTFTPSFYMDTHGLAGIGINLGKSNTSYQQYSIVSTVTRIGNQIDTNDPGSVGGVGFIAGFFLLTTVIIPNLQLIALLLMWVLNLSLKNQKKLYLLNEALGAWQYLEVYIIAIGVATLQMADISSQIARPLCKDLGGTFELMTSIGLVEKIDANCFTVLAGVENGIYILLIGAVLLNIINVFICKAAMASLQDRESRLRGDALEGKAVRPKSFFRDSCIKYLLFSCCCCLRYVAEEHDEDNVVKDAKPLASNSSGTRKHRVTSLIQHWGGSGKMKRKASVVDIFVPKERNGLPPHWEEATSDDGTVYYWHALTGESQWEKPVKHNRKRLSRTELMDEATGKVYYWNQNTGSTRWKQEL